MEFITESMELHPGPLSNIFDINHNITFHLGDDGRMDVATFKHVRCLGTMLSIVSQELQELTCTFTLHL